MLIYIIACHKMKIFLYCDKFFLICDILGGHSSDIRALSLFLYKLNLKKAGMEIIKEKMHEKIGKE